MWKKVFRPNRVQGWQHRILNNSFRQVLDCILEFQKNFYWNTQAPSFLTPFDNKEQSSNSGIVTLRLYKADFNTTNTHKIAAVRQVVCDIRYEAGVQILQAKTFCPKTNLLAFFLQSMGKYFLNKSICHEKHFKLQLGINKLQVAPIINKK